MIRVQEKPRRKASQTQNIGAGILLATIVVGLVVGLYMMRDGKIKNK